MDGGAGVEIRKRAAALERGLRAAGGEERIGREESGRESGYSFSSAFCSSFGRSEEEDKRRRLGLGSSILYSSFSDRSPCSRS